MQTIIITLKMANNLTNTGQFNGSNSSENNNQQQNAVLNYRNQFSLLIDSPEKRELFLQVVPSVIQQLHGQPQQLPTLLVQIGLVLNMNDI